jgi:hypothetical protein
MSESLPPSTRARLEAQRLAFAPLLFQAGMVLRESGLLAAVGRARAKGLTDDEGAAECGLSRYAAGLLLEAGFAAGLCACEPEATPPRFTLTDVGRFWLFDELTRVNADFTQHVCYRGAFHLGESLRAGLPKGLPTIDATGAATVYEALRSLPDEARRAWFAFDHFYSDSVFGVCLPRVLEGGAPHVVDIGANTGRFAKLALEQGAGRVSLVDLPGQLAVAKEHLRAFEGRLAFVAGDIRHESTVLPRDADAYWMSQFLDCFSEDDARLILTRVAAAAGPRSKVYVLETYWDQQRHEASRHCVIGTSLYFACIANGQSRMFHSGTLKGLARDAGLALLDEVRDLGLAHTLHVFGKRS